VLRRRLLFKPYRLQLVQALRAKDKVKRAEFCERTLQNTEDDKFLPRVIFSDESTLHLSGKVNRHNVRIWELQNPHTTLEHERDSPKVNVFCATAQTKVYGPFFFDENTVTGVTYLAMLQNWLLPQINEDSEDFIFQQQGLHPIGTGMFDVFSMNLYLNYRYVAWGMKTWHFSSGHQGLLMSYPVIFSCGGS
jgi:hypothetical protein